MGKFVTIDGRPVFVGGPSQGAGRASGGQPLSMDNTFQEWKNSLSPDEHKAIDDYANSKYTIVNASLRELPGFDIDDDLSNKQKETIQRITSGIDGALQRSPMPDDVTSFRRMGNLDTSDWKEGMEFTDSGYVSTSMSTEYVGSGGHSGAVAQIRVPKGTRGAFIGFADDSLGFAEEQELLLARGLKFRVMQNDTSGLVLEVVP